VLEDNLKAITKPQYVDQIPKALKEKVDRSVGNLITTRCDVSQDRLKEIRETLGMCENPNFETLKILTLA
jgi:ATP-binding cassette subfamily E protein 1